MAPLTASSLFWSRFNRFVRFARPDHFVFNHVELNLEIVFLFVLTKKPILEVVCATDVLVEVVFQF